MGFPLSTRTYLGSQYVEPAAAMPSPQRRNPDGGLEPDIKLFAPQTSAIAGILYTAQYDCSLHTLNNLAEVASSPLTT